MYGPKLNSRYRKLLVLNFLAAVSGLEMLLRLKFAGESFPVFYFFNVYSLFSKISNKIS